MWPLLRSSHPGPSLFSPQLAHLFPQAPVHHSWGGGGKGLGLTLISLSLALEKKKKKMLPLCKDRFFYIA